MPKRSKLEIVSRRQSDLVRLLHVQQAALPGAPSATCATRPSLVFSLKPQMAEMGQGRDCFGLFGEDRIRIPKPPWRAWDREKTGTAACDPPETNAVIRRECSRRSCLIEGSISAPGRLRKFGVPELLNAIGGIADADFVGLAAAIGERCEAEDYLVKLQSRELGAGFHVPEPDGVVTGA